MKTLRKILTAGAIGLASLMPLTGKVEAQSDSVKVTKREVTVSPLLEIVKSQKDDFSFLRPSVYVRNGDAFDVYAFTEIYKGKGQGYFGKVIASTELDFPVQPTTEMVYSGSKGLSDFKANFGFGLKHNVKVLPKRASLSLKALPYWISSKPDKDRHKFVAGYVASVDLPFGFGASSFADFNVDAKGTNAPRWMYGEAQLSKKINDNVSIAYNPLLKSRDRALPRVEHAFSASIKF